MPERLDNQQRRVAELNSQFAESPKPENEIRQSLERLGHWLK